MGGLREGRRLASPLFMSRVIRFAQATREQGERPLDKGLLTSGAGRIRAPDLILGRAQAEVAAKG